VEEIVVVTRTQELYVKVSNLTDKLPALKKQTIGRRLENNLLLLLELLIMAKHAPVALKAPYLIKATAQAEITQFQLRLLLTQNLANETTLHQLQANILEIGRMLGGWYKSVK
jgi:hypothetical protein